MTEQPQPSPQYRPKSLLQTHQDAHVLVKALNEFAASQQMPSIMSNSSPVERESQADPSSSSASVPRPVNGSGIPVVRRRPRQSEQPTVAMLAELGVKARDFAYESTLPPVPTVYLQPRQIQPSVPKDVNDPNDPHYVLEEERKKKVYTFQSTRKIERTPTEPVLESDLLPPPRRSFPKIKRTDALLDLGSQSQPQSQPAPMHPTLPYDITNTSFSASQPVREQSADPQQAGTWVHTPIVTPSGSHQWPSAETMDEESDVPPPQLESTRTESRSPYPSEPMSYFQMGLADSILRLQSSGTRASHVSRSSNVVGLVPITTPGSASAGGGRVESKGPSPSVLQSSLAATSVVEHPRKRSPISEPPPSYSRQQTPSPRASPAAAVSPRYNLRHTKRRAESSHPPSSPRSSRRPQPQRAPIKIVNPSIHVSAISTHKASANVISTGRTVKRARASSFSSDGEEGLRRSKRRSQRS